ncbi:hypothetical protein [Deinococcus apachensis]|uniref:hypothetical protein n=1 Tax=Deinococcus apachensis TaxID=309886 RepID=UPI000378E99E|nr:hypothetical protein [Deinococcus apachensis]
MEPSFSPAASGPRAATPPRPAPWSLLGIGAAPLVMALLGLMHPGGLTPATAHHWTLLHLGLIPLFPLIGVNLWWLLSGVPGPWAWLARAGAFLYAAYYPAVDLLAGVAAGRLVDLGVDRDSTAVRELFRQANTLGDVGDYALLAACVLALVALWPALGARILPGGAALLVGAWLFTEHHIYPPLGVTGMLLLAVAFVWLLALWQRARRSFPA